MQIWKFLLVGITGDLSRRKILPALAQFAEQNQLEAQIELIGFSRSEPNIQEINKILNENTSTGKHVLPAIRLLQGDYGDGSYLFDLIGSLQENERLVVYLAVPPHIFVKILQNSCPFSDKQIDIIIEKPFGRDLEEAQHMLNVIQACDLKEKVHFCDHYLFKTAAHISKAELNNFKEIKTKIFKKITIQALEEVDTKDRGGYYDGTGAVKDIFIHLFSLLDLALSFYTDLNLDTYNSFQIQHMTLGQYQTYLQDIQVDRSFTETYFYTETNITIDNHKIPIVFESGKKLGKKLTQILIEFTDGSTFCWQIAPDQFLEYQSPENSLSLNLSKNNKLDHTNLFEDLLEGKHDQFVSPQEIITSWNMYDRLVEFGASRRVKVQMYRDNIWPVQILTTSHDKI